MYDMRSTIIRDNEQHLFTKNVNTNMCDTSSMCCMCDVSYHQPLLITYIWACEETINTILDRVQISIAQMLFLNDFRIVTASMILIEPMWTGFGRGFMAFLISFGAIKSQGLQASEAFSSYCGQLDGVQIKLCGGKKQNRSVWVIFMFFRYKKDKPTLSTCPQWRNSLTSVRYYVGFLGGALLANLVQPCPNPVHYSAISTLSCVTILKSLMFYISKIFIPTLSNRDSTKKGGLP